MASVVRLNGGPIDWILEGLMVWRAFSNLMVWRDFSKGHWLRQMLEMINHTALTLPMKAFEKARKRKMSKQAMREETERLVKEALERKTLTIKQGKTRIDSKCRKCGALNRVSAAQGQVRVPYVCKECDEKQMTF